MSPNDMSKNIVNLLLLNDHTQWPCPFVGKINSHTPLLTPLHYGPGGYQNNPKDVHLNQIIPSKCKWCVSNNIMIVCLFVDKHQTLI